MSIAEMKNSASFQMFLEAVREKRDEADKRSRDCTELVFITREQGKVMAYDEIPEIIERLEEEEALEE